MLAVDDGTVPGAVGSESEERGHSGAPAGVSEFLGSVLKQLSLTAWLPAAMLVGLGAVLAELYSQGTPSLAAALSDLTDSAVGVAIGLLFGVVLAAVVTQAFSFETIRALEGYWGLNAASRRLLHWRTGVHRRRRARLQMAVREQREVAFEGARRAMCRDGLPIAIIEVLEDDFYGRPPRRRRSRRVLAAARTMGWRAKADPGALATLDRLERRTAEFPAGHRVLPTRLGNVIRAAEDSMVFGGGDLEGMLMRSYEVIPRRLMQQHDQFRDRLDMYCTLVPVFVGAAMGSGLLAVKGTSFFAVAAAGVATSLILAWVSYEAAIASARGYGAALRAIAGRVSAPAVSA